MSVVYPSSVITEFWDGSDWFDISSYVVSEILCNGGFATGNPDEFTPSLGVCQFDLNNDGGLFTIYGGDSARGLDTLSGWVAGAKIRHRVSYGGFEKTVWFGFLREAVSDDGTWGDQRVHVTCYDWIDVVSRYPMKRSEILLDKTLLDGVQSVVDRISVSPEGVNGDTSYSTFPAIFDNVREKTKALGEIDKLARSELGRVYVLKDGVLRVESFETRNGTKTLTQVPVASRNALLVSPDCALLVSPDNALLISEIEDANIATRHEKIDLRMAEKFWNDAFIKTYPTKTDTSFQVLFQIGTAITIAAGATVEFFGNYVDPNGGLPINGTLMQTPVATTDYLMNSAEDGSGTDLTNKLTVTADYYGDVVVYRLTSSHTDTAYITKLQARGLGIHRTSYIESHSQITGSVLIHGEKTLEINQTYQTDPYPGLVYGASVLEVYKTPKTRVVSARFLANLNASHMLSFLYLDIGSIVNVYDNRSEMYKWYHITSREFLILLGGMIVVTYGLCEYTSFNSGVLSAVRVGFSGSVSGDGIDFGYLSHVAGDDVTSFSVSFWMYPRAVTGDFQTIFNIYTSDGGNTYIFMPGDGGGSRILSLQASRFSSSLGRWTSPTNVFNLNTKSHFVVTYEIDASKDPKIYINGVSQTVTEAQTPSGSLRSSVGGRLIIGNTGQYANGINAILEDVRFYKNKILTASEVEELYNDGIPDTSIVTDALSFQAFAINSDLGDGSSLDGQQIPAGNNFFDNVLLMPGVPHGNPVIEE